MARVNVMLGVNTTQNLLDVRRTLGVLKPTGCNKRNENVLYFFLLLVTQLPL